MITSSHQCNHMSWTNRKLWFSSRRHLQRRLKRTLHWVPAEAQAQFFKDTITIHGGVDSWTPVVHKKKRSEQSLTDDGMGGEPANSKRTLIWQALTKWTWRRSRFSARQIAWLVGFRLQAENRFRTQSGRRGDGPGHTPKWFCRHSPPSSSLWCVAICCCSLSCAVTCWYSLLSRFVLCLRCLFMCYDVFFRSYDLSPFHMTCLDVFFMVC